jgi:D-beta-D-heptose 7-phosphate kinase/D-beta-D-heptose 1-phosphate adenosyltransferase
MPRVEFEFLSRIAGRRLLVIGDAMLDTRIDGLQRGLSGDETPVVQVRSRVESPGGAANAACAAARLGGRVELIAGIGLDPAGDRLRKHVAAARVHAEWRVTPTTTTKTRVRAGGVDLVRFDVEDFIPIGAGDLWPAVDAVLVADYGKGVVDAAVCGRVFGLGVPVVFDPKRLPLAAMRGAAAVTPSWSDARVMVGGNDEDVAPTWIAALPATAVIITRGEDGLIRHRDADPDWVVPSAAGYVADAVGAGDALAAALALGLAAGMSVDETIPHAVAAAADAISSDRRWIEIGRG